LGGRDQKKEEEEGAKRGRSMEHGKEYSKGEGEVLEARRWPMADG
jgi:hypothetical protein